MDITHYKALSTEDVANLEDMANKVVMRNLRIEKSFMDRAIAEKLYGFRLYQGGCVPGKELRVVNIPEWDVEACGGTHCDYTGEVGFIKLLGTKRIQDGVVRLEYAAGDSAVKHVRELEKNLARVRKELQDYKVESAKPSDAERTLVDLMMERSESIDKTKVVSGILTVNSEELQKLVREITKRGDVIAIIGSKKEGTRMIIARSNEEHLSNVNCASALGEVLHLIEGSGGGKSDYAQGGGLKSEGLSEAIEKARNVILSLLQK